MASGVSCGFTLDHYRQTLKTFLDARYKILGFEMFLDNCPRKAVILRHDVDLKIEPALRVAKIDAAMGCTSTFFFRIHAQGYNLFDLNNYRHLKEIALLGHEIGFHIEPSFFSVVHEEKEAFLERERAVFEGILGKSITGISTHEPTRADDPDLVEKLVRRWGLKYSAYENRFTKDIKYISDSSGRWREGCFHEWINKADRLQVLVHPTWWYEKATQENY